MRAHLFVNLPFRSLQLLAAAGALLASYLVAESMQPERVMMRVMVDGSNIGGHGHGNYSILWW